MGHNQRPGRDVKITDAEPRTCWLMEYDGKVIKTTYWVIIIRLVISAHAPMNFLLLQQCLKETHPGLLFFQPLTTLQPHSLITISDISQQFLAVAPYYWPIMSSRFIGFIPGQPASAGLLSLPLYFDHEDVYQKAPGVSWRCALFKDVQKLSPDKWGKTLDCLMIKCNNPWHILNSNECILIFTGKYYVIGHQT